MVVQSAPQRGIGPRLQHIPEQYMPAQAMDGNAHNAVNTPECAMNSGIILKIAFEIEDAH